MTDAIDIAALRAGDERAFRRLIEAYHPLLIAVVRPLVGADQAEEVVQEAWIKAYQNLGTFAGRAQVKSWLCSIALNEAKMLLRRRKRETGRTTRPHGTRTDTATDALAGRFDERGHWRDPPAAWAADSPDALLMQANLAECLEKTLDGLPANQQALLRLRDIDGQSFETICNALELNASNARVLLHRARAALYRMLEHYEETGEC